MVAISELYGKRIISLDGKRMGEVKGVMLNMEDGTVSHLLTTQIENLTRSPNVRTDFIKNSIAFARVKKIDETIIVGEQKPGE